MLAIRCRVALEDCSWARHYTVIKIFLQSFVTADHLSFNCSIISFYQALKIPFYRKNPFSMSWNVVILALACVTIFRNSVLLHHNEPVIFWTCCLHIFRYTFRYLLIWKKRKVFMLLSRLKISKRPQLFCCIVVQFDDRGARPKDTQTAQTSDFRRNRVDESAEIGCSTTTKGEK